MKHKRPVIDARRVANYPLHYLASDNEFESLVWEICRDQLGEGVTKFSDGRDGGRDAKFNGTANSFPSKAAPLSGRIIVQSKWTSAETGSCSETSFQNQLIKEEAKKAKKLCEAGELDHWIIFTNRKKSGGADASLEKALLAATGAKTVHLRGREDICGYLRGFPELIRRYNLQQFLPPLRIHPDALRAVVTKIHKRWPREGGVSSFNFDNYKGIDAKNLKNGMRPEYFQFIKDSSEPHFKTVKEFLENPRNAKLAARYHDVADEFQHKIIVYRNNFTDFAEIIDALYDEIVGGGDDELAGADEKRLARVMLHYMYCNCDIGDKP